MPLDTYPAATPKSPLVVSDQRAMSDSTRPLRSRAVLVHAGARDSYQLAIAMADAGLLERLVTDFFWGGKSRFSKFLPTLLLQKLRARSTSSLPNERVKLYPLAGVGGILLDKAKFLPFTFRRWLTRWSDAKLGEVAGKLASDTNSFIVSYSYYGFDAFQALGRADILFQMHPHPATMRRLLEEEMERHPESSASLKLEWELSLPEKDYQHLIAETKMARHFLVASSFTRDSLIEHGVPTQSISVVPYGVNLDKFRPASAQKRVNHRQLRLLFVGRINQRKGLRYLLEALQQFQSREVHLTICGRVLDGLEELKAHSSMVTVRSSVDSPALLREFQEADLFILPSIAEGFGQVLLEAMACGLPILSTTRTAAPDLIDDGVHGFIVAPQRADLIAERIAWAITNREELAAMGRRARQRAEAFTWERFRRISSDAIAAFMHAAERTQWETK